MRSLFLALIFSCGVFAENIYRDECLEMEIQVPEGLHQTWNIHNCQTGLSLTVFNTYMVEDDFNVIVLAKIPFVMTDEQSVDVLELLLNEFCSSFSSEGELFLENDYYVEPMAPISSDFSHRFRVHIGDEDCEDEILMDLHLFSKNDHSCVIVTGGLEFDNAEDLEAFSQAVIRNVKFGE